MRKQLEKPKFYEMEDNSFLITHNQKRYEVIRKDGGIIQISDDSASFNFNSLQEFIYFVNILTDIGESLLFFNKVGKLK